MPLWRLFQNCRRFEVFNVFFSRKKCFLRMMVIGFYEFFSTMFHFNTKLVITNFAILNRLPK